MTMANNTRTMAFQIPETLFQRIKFTSFFRRNEKKPPEHPGDRDALGASHPLFSCYGLARPVTPPGLGLSSPGFFCAVLRRL